MQPLKAKLATTLRITCSYRGKQVVKEIKGQSVLIGRPSNTAQPDLDLSLDINVSRQHARLWVEDGAYWIEDLGSKFGTRLNNEEIKGKGKLPLPPGAILLVGDTTLRLEIPTEPLEPFAVLPHENTPGKPHVKIDSTLDANAPAFDITKTDT